MRDKYDGFTLIELMIAMAIIGVLIGAALPFYHQYLMKSQVHRAISELAAYKAPFETQFLSSSTVTNRDLGYVVSDITSGSSAINIGVLNPDGSGRIEVTMGSNAHSDLSGIILRFERNTTGTWICKIDASPSGRWRDAYRPQGCSAL